MDLDAYVFAAAVTTAAVDALKARVSPNGPIRVVCPLQGDPSLCDPRSLYVAVTGATDADIVLGVGTVATTSGVGLLDSYTVDAGVAGLTAAKGYPTYAAVGSWVGFGLFHLADGAAPIERDDRIIGVARVRTGTDGGGRSTVLVEVTGPDLNSVRGSLETVAARPGVEREFSAWGEVRNGAGFVQSA